MTDPIRSQAEQWIAQWEAEAANLSPIPDLRAGVYILRQKDRLLAQAKLVRDLLDALAARDPQQDSFDLAAFSRINRERCESASGFNHQLDSWSLSDWFTAVVGELGEAANIAKKLNRVRDGIPGNKQTPEELRAMLSRELADAFIYLDLLAQSAGFTLADVVSEVFNAKSEELGCPIRHERGDPRLAPQDHEEKALGSCGSPESLSPPRRRVEESSLCEWLTRYGQILEATDKLLHEIRFCSNADELWRRVGFSQPVEDLHTRVIYESGAVEKELRGDG